MPGTRSFLGLADLVKPLLHALPRLWIIRSAAWRWGLAFEFLFWDMVIFLRVFALPVFPFLLDFFISSRGPQLNTEVSINGMELDAGELRKNQHSCGWKSSMADHEPFVLH